MMAVGRGGGSLAALHVATCCVVALAAMSGCSESRPPDEADLVDMDSTRSDGAAVDGGGDDRERFPTSRASFAETSLGEFGGPIIAFHSRNGDRQTVVLANGEVWFRPFSECLGRQQVHAGRLQSGDATRLFDEVDSLEFAEDVQLTTCQRCVHCGFQRLELAREGTG